MAATPWNYGGEKQWKLFCRFLGSSKPAGGRATLGLGAEFVHTGRVSAQTVHWPTHLSDKCQTFGKALPEPYLPGAITVRIVAPEELFMAANDPELDLASISFGVRWLEATWRSVRSTAIA